MIRRLSLRNWRAYEDIDLRFSRGTTFIVASNGIGKTSLIEAARWALYGEHRAAEHDAVRKGALAAVASVVLELPDGSELTIKRTLPAKPRAARPAPSAWLGDVEIDPGELDSRLSNAYGGRPAFLAGVTMPASGADSGPAGLGTEEHLGLYFGVDGLRELIDQLDEDLRVNATEIKNARSTSEAAAGELGRLDGEVEEARRRAEAATTAHDLLDRRRQRRIRWDFYRREQQEVQRDNARSESVRAELAARTSAELATMLAHDRLPEAVEAEVDTCDRRIEDLRVARAVNTSRVASLDANQDRLDTAHEDCPVCRRPLDAQTVVIATQTRSDESRSLRSANDELFSVEQGVSERRDRLVALLAEWRAVPRPRTVSDVPEFEDDPVALEDLGLMAQQALDDRVEARARLLQVEADREESAAAVEAMRELTKLYRRQAALRVVQQTARSTLTELLEETVRPLAAEVNQRWQALFPDRGALDTALDGTVSRTIGEHSLPYGSFSTGEGTSLIVLFRLLVAQMMTSVDFCWFDEPLEHLDPDTRRRVGSLLSRVTVEGGPVQQVVVTTYEEPLARRLQARDEENVTLLDVRHS